MKRASVRRYKAFSKVGATVPHSLTGFEGVNGGLTVLEGGWKG